jgi:cytochrome c-type biogenesis protein CcmE
MAEPHWEKDDVLKDLDKRSLLKRGGRWKYLVIGIALLGVIAYLIVFSTGERYYVTVNELLDDPEMLDKPVRVSGAVVGDVNDSGPDLHFTIAHIPKHNDEIKKMGGLQAVMGQAIADDSVPRMRVVARNMGRPDLLEEGNQAILEGKLVEENGQTVFYADDILLKCPSKYEEKESEAQARSG